MEDSLTLLTHEIDVYPTIEAYANRAEAYSMDGLHEKAVSDYTEVIRMAQAQGRVEVIYRGYIGRGAAEMGRDDASRAIDDYLIAIEIIPDEFIAYNNLGNSYRAIRDYQRAISSYLKAAELRPEVPQPFFNLGLAYHEMNDDEKALAYMEAAARLGSKEASDYLLTRTGNAGK